MDRGLWITWYDLADDGRDAYLAWLHGTYIPALLKRPGYRWAAHYAAIPKHTRPSSLREAALNHADDATLPTGDRYILLVGAEDAHRFGDPVPSVLNAAQSEEGRRMLNLRTGTRVNVMTEAARVEGPEAKGYKDGVALAPCIQLGNFNSRWQDEEEVLAWYAQWRMPAMQKLPGIIRTRRFASIAGWAKHIVLYEWTSLAARNANFLTHEDADPKMKAWSDRVVPKLIHAPGSSSVACRIWPAV
jgi:hypothetical protein